MNSSFVDTADAMGGRLIHPEKSVWLGAKSASFFGNEKLGDHQRLEPKSRIESHKKESNHQLRLSVIFK